MNTGIYIIKNNINEKVYIGSSGNIKRRISEHFSELKRNRHPNIIFQRLYNKYKNNIILNYEILELCEMDNLFQREQYYIDTCENPLLNITKIVTDISKFRDRLQHNQNISTGLIGHKFSEETKMKISNTLTGVKLSQERIEKKYVKINQFSLNGEFIRTWDSIKEASKYFNIERNRISYCLKNPQNSYIDSFWRYYDMKDLSGIDILPAKNKRKVGLLENGKVIREFESLIEAGIKLGIGSSKIGEVCKGKRNHTFGYKFKYL